MGAAFLSITLTDLEALFPVLFRVIWNPSSQQSCHYTCELHYHNHHSMFMKEKSSSMSAASSALNDAREIQILG